MSLFYCYWISLNHFATSELVNSSRLKFSCSTFPQSCFFWDYYISKSLTLFSKSQIVHVLPLRSNKFSFLAIGISSFGSFLSLLDVFESFCHKQKFWKVCKSVSHEWLWASWEDGYGFHCKYLLPQRHFPGSVGNVWKHVKL